VTRVDAHRIVVSPDPPQRKTTASRSPQGTRRPSEPRSKR
jgi:hypothetical protein